MKTDLEEKLIVAEACEWRQFAPNCDLFFKGNVFTTFDTIDSILEAVLMQSEKFQREFAKALQVRCNDFPGFDDDRFYLFHQLTPADWRRTFVETWEKMKK